MSELEAVTLERLAEVVDAISVGVTQIRKSGISERALAILIREASPSKVTLTQIRATLDGMEALSEFVFPPEREEDE